MALVSGAQKTLRCAKNIQEKNRDLHLTGAIHLTQRPAKPGIFTRLQQK